MEEYVKHLDWVFGQLRWAELKIKVKKYEFTKFKIKLLGYRILAKEMISDSSKVAAIETLK